MESQIWNLNGQEDVVDKGTRVVEGDAVRKDEAEESMVEEN